MVNNRKLMLFPRLKYLFNIYKFTFQGNEAIAVNTIDKIPVLRESGQNTDSKQTSKTVMYQYMIS